MDKREYDIGYTRLTHYFLAKDNVTRYEEWWGKLKRYPNRAYEVAVDRVIEGERFFPTLSVLRLAINGAMTPEEKAPAGSLGDVSPAEESLGAQLAPLFQRYLKGLTTKEDWISQMRWFAKQNGLGRQMEDSITDTGIERDNHEREQVQSTGTCTITHDGEIPCTVHGNTATEVSTPSPQHDNKRDHGVIKRPVSIEDRLRSNEGHSHHGENGSAQSTTSGPGPDRNEPTKKPKGGW